MGALALKVPHVCWQRATTRKTVAPFRGSVKKQWRSRRFENLAREFDEEAPVAAAESAAAWV